MERHEGTSGRFQVEQLEDRFTPAIVTTTSVLKVPGPTDVVVTEATNPAGHHPPGHQDVVELSNREAKAFR
jgi:hypothetical protein